MLEQFVGLILGRLTVVASHRDVQVRGEHVPAQRFDPPQRLFRNDRRIRARTLGQGDRHCGIFHCCRLPACIACFSKHHVVVWFGWTVLQLFSHIPQVDWPPGVYPHDYLLQVFNSSKERARFDLKFTVVAGEAAGQPASICVPQLCGDCARCQTVGGQTLRVEHHPQLPRLPADDRRLRDVIELLERVLQLAGNSPQAVRVVILSPQRERQDGHVVNRADLDDGLGNPGRNAVEVGVKLVVGLYDRIFFFRAYVKAHNQQAHPRVADRVDVLNSRHFAEQSLHGQADALCNFFRGGTRHLHEDVEHGNDDLWLFLARGLEDGKSAKQEGPHDHERGQLGVDEATRNPSREPQSIGFGRALFHYSASIRFPFSSSSPDLETSFSPSCNPARISTSWPEDLPNVTYRRLAILF